ncbi:MAG: rhomboid family intramembrane serine protease [bacterium]|jgi:membrane associated rhomboid family serine protease
MTPVVQWLLLLNIGVHILLGYNPLLRIDLAFIPALVVSRPWTLITYMFVHGSFWHLLMNMLGLFFFGPRVEARLGSRAFLGLYLVSGLGGALFSLFTPYAAVIGASGAVFGVMLAFAMFWPHEPILLWAVVPVPARLLVIVMAVLSLYSGLSGAGAGVAHFAHLGGFAGGFFYVRLLRRREWQRIERAGRPTMVERYAAELRIDTSRWEAIRREELHEINRAEVDRIMEKLRTQGAASLTPDERAFMDRMAAR